MANSLIFLAFFTTLESMQDLYNSPDLARKDFVADMSEQEKIMVDLEKREDVEAMRIKRYLAMADLSRTVDTPLHEIIERVTNLPIFQNFDLMQIPEIVPAIESFDLFDFPAEHPARSKSDTYYVDEKNILRTHTTVMWYYYLLLPEIKEKLKQGKTIGLVSYGKVYRKDEIDRHHMNIFHQIIFVQK
jgi:phenylalanyl-tRNA synthetase alpha chain